MANTGESKATLRMTGERYVIGAAGG